MTTLLPYQTTELSDEIDPCEKSRLAHPEHSAYPADVWLCLERGENGEQDDQ
jgi:hypothetical protein